MTRRTPIRSLHAAAGMLAFLTILTFWTSTIVIELFGSDAAVANVKIAIAWTLLVLVPSIAITGITGTAMAGRNPRGIVGSKLARMKIIGANGILVMTPSALFLAWKASWGTLDTAFYAVQAIELLAGAANLMLMGLNIRDGLQLSGRFRPVKPAGSARPLPR